MLYEAKKWYKALTGHILKRSRHQEAKNLIFGLSARLCQLVSLIFPAEWIKKRWIEKIGWMDSKKKVNDNTIAPYFRSQLTNIIGVPHDCLLANSTKSWVCPAAHLEWPDQDRIQMRHTVPNQLPVVLLSYWRKSYCLLAIMGKFDRRKWRICECQAHDWRDWRDRLPFPRIHGRLAEIPWATVPSHLAGA